MNFYFTPKSQCRRYSDICIKPKKIEASASLLLEIYPQLFLNFSKKKKQKKVEKPQTWRHGSPLKNIYCPHREPKFRPSPRAPDTIIWHHRQALHSGAHTYPQIVTCTCN